MMMSIIKSALIAGGIIGSAPAIAAGLPSSDRTSPGSAVRDHLHVGLGIGSSTLTPNTNNTNDAFDVLDSTDTARQIILGWRFNRRFSMEMVYADLGSSGLSQGAEIDYQQSSISGLAFIQPRRLLQSLLPGRYSQGYGGLSLFGRLGVGTMSNRSRNVVFSRVNDTQRLIGFGAEYQMRSRFGVRLEHISYDQDSSATSLSLLYRFASSPWSRVATSSVTPAPVTTESPVAQQQSIVTTPPLAAALAPTVKTAQQTAADRDNDGIPDRHDRCPSTGIKVEVGDDGCMPLTGVIRGVNFETGSAILSAQAWLILQHVAHTLAAYPSLRVSIHAHTDSIGDRESNSTLSQNRAFSVVNYLEQIGVQRDRLQIRAFGESRLIATDSTASGRAKNRRIEIAALTE